MKALVCQSLEGAALSWQSVAEPIAGLLARTGVGKIMLTLED